MTNSAVASLKQNSCPELYSAFSSMIDDSELPSQVLHRGEYLFHTGDKFRGLFILVSGSAKSFSVSDTGDQQINSFLMPGDVIGLDGHETNHYACTIEFLETSCVKRISIKSLMQSLTENSALMQTFLGLVSQSFKNHNYRVFSLCNLDSEERLASFLLDQSRHFKHRGFSERIFNLSMSRIDIANYLGMTIETTSRLMKRLQQKGIIRANRGHIIITDIDELQQIVKEKGGDRSSFYSHNISAENNFIRESA